MDTNQVSLTRTMLNISTPDNQGLNFSQGEIVKGVVQEVHTDGTLIITIKGQTIEAMTEVQVQPGQQLYLKVDDFRDGKTFLKVVTPQAMEVIENANLSANLLNMGISAKEENVAMARKLLEYNMPVTANNMSEMAKGVKLLGAATPRSLEIVAFVMSRNLPVDASTLKAMEQYTLPGSNIAKLIQSVVQSLRELGQTQYAAPAANLEMLLSAGLDKTGTNANAAYNSSAMMNNNAVDTNSNPGSGISSSQAVSQNPPARSSQVGSSPIPTVSGQAASAGRGMPLQSGPQGPVVSGPAPTVSPDAAAAVNMVVPGESDSAATAAPVNPAGSQGALPASAEIPLPATQSNTSVPQPALNASALLPETAGAEFRADTAAVSSSPVAQGASPAPAVTEGIEAPGSPVSLTGNADVPEEIPGGRVLPNIPESTGTRPVSPPPGQAAPATIIADAPELADKPVAMPASTAAFPEGEATANTTIAPRSQMQDEVAAGSAGKSSIMVPGADAENSQTSTAGVSKQVKGVDQNQDQKSVMAASAGTAALPEEKAAANTNLVNPTRTQDAPAGNSMGKSSLIVPGTDPESNQAITIGGSEQVKVVDQTQAQKSVMAASAGTAAVPEEEVAARTTLTNPTRTQDGAAGGSMGKSSSIVQGMVAESNQILTTGGSDQLKGAEPMQAQTSVTAAVPEEDAAAKTTVANLTRTQDNVAGGSMGKPAIIAPGTAAETNQTLNTGGSEQLKGVDANQAQMVGNASGNTTAGTGRTNDQINLLRTLIEWMQVDGQEPAVEISGKIERTIASDKDVIRGLTLLQDALKSENTQARSPVVHDLLQRIDNLEKELSGQKMFNYLSRTTNDNQFNFYYFSIPVRVGEEMHQCQLRFNKDGRRDLRNVDNLSFVVSLDTGNMGLVLFHVNWQRSGSLTLQGIAESDSVAQHLNGNIQGLVGKLNDLGYSVQNLGIKISREQIDESLKIRVNEAPLTIRPLGIDIMV